MFQKCANWKYSGEPGLTSLRIIGLTWETQKLRPTRKAEIGKDFNCDNF